MARALLAAVLMLSCAAAAQTAPAQTGQTPPAQPVPAPAPQTPEPQKAAPPPATTDAQQLDQVKDEVDKKVEAAKKEMREEIRAQLATQSAAQGWEEEWVEQSRKLELLELDGYFRVRPDLFHKLDLGRVPDPDGYTLFPLPITSPRERTLAGVNMRLRLDPTINVSEEVRVKMQIDALDNVMFGSTPQYAFSRSERNEFGVMDEGQNPPQSGLNAVTDSIVVRRVYGEVSTPVGILRFGRMGSHWGLGMVHNDGNCMDCDYGETVDRIQFVTEPFTGWYVAPMVDFNVEGLSSKQANKDGEPFDLSNTDDAHGYVIAIARRDTEQQERAKLENDLGVLNYGLHFTYRVQKYEPTGWKDANDPSGVTNTFQPRNASLYIPDLWAKYERKAFRVELEAAAYLGSLDIQPPSTSGDALTQQINIVQFGAVAQGEYRFMDGQLRLEVEAGYASGDKAPGFGNYPGRAVKTDPDGNTVAGDIDGRQYVCRANGTCPDNFIRNFRFNRDYRIDSILFRELIGGITDTVYVKPTLTYQVAEGFHIYGSLVGSGAVYPESTPSAANANPDRLLGLEINAGARYETEDGFVAGLQWGILFPQAGLNNPAVGGATTATETAQAIRAMLGVKF